MALCKICNSDKLDSVDKALLAGGTCRDVAAKFAFSKDSVSRHSRNCVRRAMARAVVDAANNRALVERGSELTDHIQRTAAERQLKLADRLQDQVEYINQITLSILQEALTEQDKGTALKALKQLCVNVQLTARMSGQLDPKDNGAHRTVTLEEFQEIFRQVGAEATEQ